MKDDANKETEPGSGSGAGVRFRSASGAAPIEPAPKIVTDEEVYRRLEDLRSGGVKGLSEEEFWRACGR